jgi:ribonucleoside-diphosphate reductase alpha chain
MTNNNNLTPRERPQVLYGITQKIKTGCGNLYVTINEDDKGVFEVFITMGKAGGCASCQSEALGRLISLSLRAGVSIDAIIRQLSGIRCPSPSWQNGKTILSCPDAIAWALRAYLKGKGKDKPGSIREPIKKPIKEPIKIKSKIAQSIAQRKSKDIVKPELNNSNNSNLNNLSQSGTCPDCNAELQHVEGCLVCVNCGYSKCG